MAAAERPTPASADLTTGTVARINVDDPAPAGTASPTAPTDAVAGGGEGSGRRATVTRRDVWGRRQRFEARRVRRLIRHVDPWSVLKASLVFFLCVWVMFMVAAVIVWTVARTSGTIDRIDSFANDIGVQGWKLDGRFIFRQYGLVGLVLALAATAAATVSSIVFNLISDIIGGVWITVIEEETARPSQ